jgi:CheY-like chemotaxis protein
VKISSPDRSVHKRPRVFIVDDDTTIALLLKAMITRLGYSCIGPAETLANALTIANNSEVAIDAALIDFVFDGQPRYELCHSLADWGIPFAFASRVAREAIEPRWRTRPLIPKPFSEPEVANVLLELLEIPDAMRVGYQAEKAPMVLGLGHPGEPIVR